jgi:4-alpha-glucanotransferase
MNEDSALHGLAAAAGIEIDWQDANGNDKVVADSTLRAVLGAIGFPAGTESDIAESRALLAREGGVAALPLTTAALGQPVTLAGKAGRFRLVLESGAVFEGVAWENAGGVQLPAIQEEGYHRLEFNDAETVIAVTAPCAHTLHDAGGGEKLWGLALQLYALRRAGDWAISRRWRILSPAPPGMALMRWRSARCTRNSRPMSRGLAPMRRLTARR